MLRRFLVEPTSRLFLSVAELFKAYDQTSDCIRLLEFGLENHPTYGAARVILAREYFDQGEFEKSLALLEKSPVSLKQNRLAQKVIFRNYILLGFFPEADEVLQRLRSFESKDEEIAQALDTIAASGHQKYRERLLQRFESGRKTKPSVELPSVQNLPLQTTASIRPVPVVSSSEGAGVHLDAIDPELFNYFRVCSLAEVFHGQEKGEGDARSISSEFSLELDSTTLADIFASQGHFRKALEIYRRLLRLSPANQALREKVRQVSEQLEQQKSTDYDVDPDMVERMEHLDSIDQRIRLLQNILDGLNQ